MKEKLNKGPMSLFHCESILTFEKKEIDDLNLKKLKLQKDMTELEVILSNGDKMSKKDMGNFQREFEIKKIKEVISVWLINDEISRRQKRLIFFGFLKQKKTEEKNAILKKMATNELEKNAIEREYCIIEKDYRGLKKSKEILSEILFNLKKEMLALETALQKI